LNRGGGRHNRCVGVYDCRETSYWDGYSVDVGSRDSDSNSLSDRKNGYNSSGGCNFNNGCLLVCGHCSGVSSRGTTKY